MTQSPVKTSCLRPDSRLQHADAVGLVPWLFEDAAVDMHGGIGGQYRQIQVQLAHRLRLVPRPAD